MVTAAPSASLGSLVKAQAYGLGFDLVGIATLGPAETAAAFDAWVARGYAGEMHYLPRGAAKRRDTRLPMAGATSAVVVGMSYGGAEPSGPVARYARGEDYHDVMLGKLRELQVWIADRVGVEIRGKAYVDTGPILERDLARRAGLGWFGKNTMLVNPRLGSFFFLGALLVDVELEPDEPFAADRCGTCTRCLDACPTDAFVGPRELDATKCISYLTIELKGPIPEELREAIGDRPYGCDVCQDVCPWNVRFAQELADDSPFAPREALAGKDARTLSREILQMTQEEFSRAFSKSPIKRAKLRGLKRNAAVVLGNVGTSEDTDVLTRALGDEEPLVREHAAWALARIERQLNSGVREPKKTVMHGRRLRTEPRADIEQE
ncbi:MAG TPA: tRNA epoxyqueuosine(34) reductase QueG [Vicinamibacterales bacterium]|nr:tRNA epoxyqueuosine(34) reductase QueG [Vicinamibacterales bacterium]